MSPKREEAPIQREAPVEPEASPGTAEREEPESTPGLSDRQRTRLEKRDTPEPVGDGDQDEKDYGHCDNHPDRESVVVTDGLLFSKQAFCEECADRNGYAVPDQE